MNQDYVKAATRTECTYDRYEQELAKGDTATRVVELMRDISESGEMADRWKKLLMYGKEPNEGREILVPEHSPDERVNAVIVERMHDPRFERLFHAALGMFTESAELFDALLDFLASGTLDEVNIAEEIGDQFWYDAIALDTVGQTPEAVAKRNIAKLLARYPAKFDETLAIVRDLQNERRVLETEA
jgi:hypothetical protein